MRCSARSVGRGVGDQFSVGDQDRLDNFQPGSAEGSAGLGNFHHGVGDFRHFRLRGAVGQHDIGLYTVGGKEAFSQQRVLGRDLDAVGHVFYGLPRGSSFNREDDLDWLRRGLRIRQFPERDDIGARLFDPVAPGYADVK